jgi:ribosomal protein L37AE/L43A
MWRVDEKPSIWQQEQKMRVVHCKREPYDVYIGRPARGLKGSIWANPFHIGKDGTREEVVEKYREYILGNPELLARLEELRGKTRGCWCSPERCHGEVLIELLEARQNIQVDTLFTFEDQPQQDKPLLDWDGNEMPIKKPIESSNPMVRAYDRGPEGTKCKDCKFLLRDKYHDYTYLKCEKRGITRGSGTDHRAKWEACGKFEQAEPVVKEEPVKQPNQPFTEVCPQCRGEIKLLYKHSVWSCSACSIKIAQTREGGITRIEPLMTFSVSPLEIK